MEMEPKSKSNSTDSIISKALKLINLIQYQEGSVVSRTIIDKQVGTVTLFAFAEG
jgi:quercetin dioxygenase-like cupin family protein